MTHLHTWSGTYFGYRDGDVLRTYDGRDVGRFKGDVVYNHKGRYLGEVKSGRLIRRKGGTNVVASVSSPFAKNAPIVKIVNYVGNVMVAGYEDFPAPDEL